VRVPCAAARCPGCDYTGPSAHIRQATMTTQYNLAAALIHGSVLLNDPALHPLIGVTALEIDEEMTRADPGTQGGEDRSPRVRPRKVSHSARRMSGNWGRRFARGPVEAKLRLRRDAAVKR